MPFCYQLFFDFFSYFRNQFLPFECVLPRSSTYFSRSLPPSQAEFTTCLLKPTNFTLSTFLSAHLSYSVNLRILSFLIFLQPSYSGDPPIQHPILSYKPFSLIHCHRPLSFLSVLVLLRLFLKFYIPCNLVFFVTSAENNTHHCLPLD